jgi:predicted ATPase with chaperone activity
MEMSFQMSSAPEARAQTSLPCRPLPQTFDDLGLPEIFLANLTLKHCFYMDVFTLANLGERLKLSTTILTQLVEYLKKEKFVEVRGPDALRPLASPLSLALRYALTDGGKSRAAQLLEHDAYVGPVPVTLEDYWQQVGEQRIKLTAVTLPRLHQVFEGLVLSPQMLEQLGPAAVSGRPLFLYGPPGNGKTTIAVRLGEIWDDPILVPYALYVQGNVIRVFDENAHRSLKEEAAAMGMEDRRWVRCRRPVVTVGGELTMAMLDLAFNPILKYYEAPLQLKANNGMFLVDDFGRQQVSPQEMLNRWIIPLENKKDYLCLHTGQKFTIPFEQFLVFATNLEPRTLVDDAFLRRIRSKVKVTHITRDQFKEIFQLVCRIHEVPYDEEAVEYLLAGHYDGGRRNMDACHPRDLLEQVLDYCHFNQIPVLLTPENLDRACRNYFVY